MRPARPLADLTEQEWDGQLFRGAKSLARSCGWLSYHTLRSKGSQPGYPDRTLVRDRIVFVETKREKAKPSPTQVEWLDALARAGGEVYVWRPGDLDEIGRILSGRPRFFPSRENGKVPPFLVPAGDAIPWTPASIWIPGKGRSDGL